MDRERWARIQEVFHEVLALPDAEREAAVRRLCGDDTELTERVLAMLEGDAGAGGLLDRGVEGAAESLLEAGDAPATAPREVGRYRLVETLGEGGMGVVYLAERPDPGGQVAIKVLRDAWLSPARRERFTAEQRTLARLNHPNIAALYDADTLEDGTPWFAMEYVDGVPLTDYCRRHATSIPGRLELLRSVCEAVLYAHRHAVIHRDIKPSNVLVKADGSVRLLDFGIAKQLESLDDPAQATRTALRMLTPAYAAPEQIRGDDVGIHSDVYSLGVILYELLTGALPYDVDRKTPSEAAEQIVAGTASPPSAAARALAAALPVGRREVGSWEDLDVLCLTAMHPDPARRYASIDALIRDIDHFLAGEPLDARPDTVGYRLGKFVRRHRRAVAASTVVLLFAVALVVFYTVRLAAARDRALAEAAKTSRIQSFMLELFAGGDGEAGPSDDLRVVTLVDRGVQEARLLDDEPEIQAELFQTLGTIYHRLGRFDRADEMLQSSLDQRRTLPESGPAGVAATLLSMGMLRISEARLDEAEPLLVEALAMARELQPRDPVLLASAITGTGRLFEERGDYDHAIERHEEALALLEDSDVPEGELARGITALANTHYYAGHYDESEALNRRALEIDLRLWGDRHPHVADDLINLGAIEFARGGYAEAEELNRRALDILRAWHGEEHPETASAMTLVGRSMVYQDNLVDAEPLLRRALEIQQRVYGPHPRVASALNDLSTVMMYTDRLEEAERLSRRQIAIYHEIYGERHPLVAIALSNVASIDLMRERWSAAEETLRDVVARFSEAYSPEDMNTAIARIKLGRALIRQERWSDAERESRAGHDLLSARTDPSVSWIQAARKDLALAYDKLGRPEEAERFVVREPE